MPFRRFVEIGRVAYCVGGPAEGKLVAIVDVIDYNRALVDGPCTGVPRQEYRFINLQLTQRKVNIQHGQRSKYVGKAWKEARIDKKWERSNWAKSIVKRETRESLTDFDRFKVARLKLKRNKLIRLGIKTDLLLKRKAKEVAKRKKRHPKKVKVVEKDPAKRKLKLRVDKIYKTLRTKGVLARNTKPKEKPAPKKVAGKRTRKTKKPGKKVAGKPVKKQVVAKKQTAGKKPVAKQAPKAPKAAEK